MTWSSRARSSADITRRAALGSTLTHTRWDRSVARRRATGSSTSSTLRVAARAEAENGAWVVTATAALRASARAAVKFTGGSDEVSASP